VITTLVDGERSDLRFLLFDQSFEAATEVEIWGTDMKWVFPLSPQWPGFRCDPLIEARYLYFHENMNVVGGFSGDGPFTTDPLGPTLLTGITSDSTNHLYGAGVGVRAQFVHPWITVGVEPRASLALNSFRNRVVAENVLANGDRQTTIEEDTIFSPIAEVGAYVKFHPTPHCTLVAGYNVFVIAQVTRPYDSIRYNLNTDPATGTIASSDISVDTEFHTMVFHGWSVGGEISFR
jgi:Putative beta barrel porin-7 (BBP7)